MKALLFVSDERRKRGKMMNFKVLNVIILFFSLGLNGCSQPSNQYNQAVDQGLEAITTEKYDEARTSFEQALEEEPEDEQIQRILEQLEVYQEAMKSLEKDELEEALSRAERTGEITNGSKELNDRSKVLIKDIQEILDQRKAEQIEEETQTEQVSNRVEETSEDSKKIEESIESTEAPYEYSDFVGYYLHFDADDRTHADMIATIGYDYLTVGWYRSNFELYQVLDSSVEENVLSVEYSIEPYGEEAEEYGTFNVSLEEDDGEKRIEFIESGMTFYQATYEEVLDYDYSIQEFLVDDMNP